MYNDWRDGHCNVMISFLNYLNSRTHDFILKGGTSLMLYYGLDRFSEAIDLDVCKNNKFDIESLIRSFCIENKIQYRIKKNTDTVKRFMIYYGGCKALKVEISYRAFLILDTEFEVKEGVAVYLIQRLAVFKLSAYLSRDRIRDLYDVTFIFRNYGDILSDEIKCLLISALEQKGMSYFDYIIKAESDELIDADKLGSDFLDLCSKLGMLYI